MGAAGFLLGRESDDDIAPVTVTREVATPPQAGDGSTIPPRLAALARRRGGELGATWLLVGSDPSVVLVVSRIPSRSGWGTNILEIWREARAGWTRLYERRRPGWIHFEIQTGEVTQDRAVEALVTEWNGGSGYCGNRLLLSVQRGRVYELFRRHYCERPPAILDGLLVVSEPIGSCPDEPGGAHCYGGLRTQLLAWRGRTRVVDRTLVHCFAGFRPERLCRRTEAG